MKRPAFQFYPADWRKDAALQSCSLSAQGLWINIMCIAHECDPYGHLVINNIPMTTAQIARFAGVSAKECDVLLVELQGSGVFTRKEDGCIFSRRMVKDERLRNLRAEGGKAGAEHGDKGASYGVLGGRPQDDKKPPLVPPLVPPLKPPPSSSSSSSSSTSVEKQKKDHPLADMPEGFNKDIWDDFQFIRKAKVAPLTKTALKGIAKQARLAGITLEDALQECCTRGWQSFRADWINKPQQGTQSGKFNAGKYIRDQLKMESQLAEKIVGSGVAQEIGNDLPDQIPF